MASPTPSLVATTLSALAASGAMPTGSVLPSGMMPSGMMPSGMMPSGMMPSGMMPSGAMPSGMMPSGAMSGGMPAGTGMPGGDSAASGMGMSGPQLSPEQLGEWRGQQVYWAVGVGLVACVAFFACRLASRYMTRVALRPSDYLLVAGIVFTGALSGCYVWSVHAGAGTHFQALLMRDATKALEGEAFKVRFHPAVSPPPTAVKNRVAGLLTALK